MTTINPPPLNPDSKDFNRRLVEVIRLMWVKMMGANGSSAGFPISEGGTGADNATDARQNLGLEIGVDVQAHSAVLDATTASFTTADETKLDGIEAGAQVNTVTPSNSATLTNKAIAFASNTITGVREQLTGNRTYYVRSDGSDSNTGLTDTSGGAFLTIQKAFDTVEALDSGGYSITIQVGAGTYAGGSYVGPVSGPALTLQGDTTTPSNVHISSVGITVFQGTLNIKGFKITASGAECVRAFGVNSTVNITGLMEFAGATRHINATNSGSVIIVSSYEITGSATFHYSAENNGKISCNIGTVTVTGTPAFSGSFADCRKISLIAFVSGFAFSGSATGVRYNVITNSVIDALGAGASFLPGGTAGITATGGQYV